MYTIDFDHPVHVYFSGIGGISMSGLAEVLLEAGFKVSGSDRQKSELTNRLEDKGVRIFFEQIHGNITPDIDCVIFTSAIHPDNPEFIDTVAQNIPYLNRAELLGQLMRNYKLPVAISGTHGKTTTTSMLSEILLAAEADPTLSIGGMLPSIGGNIRVGKGDVFVTEACEYTNSFLQFFPKVSAILNVEEDHLDFFKDLADIRRSFGAFAALLPKDGTLIINDAIPNHTEMTADCQAKILTFSTDLENKTADYCLRSISYDALAHPTFLVEDATGVVETLRLQVPGLHNVANAMAALGLADALGVPRDVTAKALAAFSGTDRRFEYKGKKNGFTIVDDYAHHPTEIAAALAAAKNCPHKRLWCVFQSHTYTRTKAFLDEFAKALSAADQVVIAPIYAARETDTLGVSGKTLQEKIKALGTECFYFDTFAEIEDFLLKNCTKDDLLITMGAGDIVKVGENLLAR